MFVLVVAKEPVPGRVKTRLCPPCTPEQAAELAEAALVDTFTAAGASRADTVVSALDGAPGPWLPDGVATFPQPDTDFAGRLGSAWSDACRETGSTGVQIGMDTPQVTSSHLDHALTTLARDDVDAVIGPAVDGGWWLIGLPADIDHHAVFADVPMSTRETGAAQIRRLEALGLRIGVLPALVDVDDIADARRVAAGAPNTAFAAALERTEAGAGIT